MATLPSWVEPQLATLTRQRFSDPGWIFERKLDGERRLAFAGSSGTRLMSRAQRDITSTFPEIARALDDRRHGELVVDGEIVAFDGKQTRFERLQQRSSRGSSARSAFPTGPMTASSATRGSRACAMTRRPPKSARDSLMTGGGFKSAPSWQ